MKIHAPVSGKSPNLPIRMEDAARKQFVLVRFPYVCPKPVLVNDHLCILKVGGKTVFLPATTTIAIAPWLKTQELQ